MCSSYSRAFTVRFTVILTGIPSRGFHYLSTCIENNRRFHNNSLARCIAIYRSQHPTTSQSMHLASRAVPRQKCSSIELPNPLLAHIFLPKLLPSVHSPRRTRSRSTPTQPPRYQVKTLSSHFSNTANNLSTVPLGRGEFGRLLNADTFIHRQISRMDYQSASPTREESFIFT